MMLSTSDEQKLIDARKLFQETELSVFRSTLMTTVRKGAKDDELYQSAKGFCNVVEKYRRLQALAESRKVKAEKTVAPQIGA